ncbi:MAG: heme ABC transporter ATP-binding protein [Bacteroidota bacterium]
MIEVQRLSVQLHRGFRLDNLEFRLEEGSVTAIIGPNGAGKSTLIRLLAGDLPITSGSIRWQGKELTQFHPKEIAQERAVLTQKMHLSQAFTAEEVVLMGRYPHFNHFPQPADLAITKAAIHRGELQALAHRSYHQVSGGEQQRIQLARAFAQIGGNNGPYLLLLDEPLNNLDLRYQHHLLQQTRDFASEGNCVLIVMHELNLASQYADQLLLLDQGKQIAVGSPEAVCQSELLSEVYQYPLLALPHPLNGRPMIIPATPNPESGGTRHNHDSPQTLSS